MFCCVNLPVGRLDVIVANFIEDLLQVGDRLPRLFLQILRCWYIMLAVLLMSIILIWILLSMMKGFGKPSFLYQNQEPKSIPVQYYSIPSGILNSDLSTYNVITFFINNII